ncbi:hypothetical protein ACKKBG_A20635 [Auxenochlorella protothecoides x Auxenochlorella symbiontica]|uniref:Uncharacterized protein n=1 Tax=Auxenochlorella protothecoides TaxID=3075 RepID=A0A087SKE1_AUXPR|nr:hypothetical protein F751_4688 [Auxenochlorella protothecoides]KFM26195.1 hypothetical protein F751_4688 [Auxenochlorella protothecoides]
MGFFTDYLTSVIQRRMEDPKERRDRAEARLRHAKAAADATKRNLGYPTKNWGFWRSDKMSAHYETNANPAVKRMLGRAVPEV